MQWKSVLSALLAQVCALPACGAWRTEKARNMSTDPQQLIASFDFRRFIERSTGSLRLVERKVTGAGIVYTFAGSRPEDKFWATVALYGGEELASEAAKDQLTRTSIGPNHMEESAHRDLFLWETKDPLSGSLLLRRLNAVIRFNDGLPWTTRLELIEQVDRMLENGGPEVTRAAEVRPPRIVEVKLPLRVRPGENIQGDIQLIGISPADALLGSASTRAVVTSGPKPTMTYYAPPQPARDSVTLIISTAGNLLSKTAIPITVE